MLIAIAIAEVIQGLGRKKDSLELKAIKAQIKNDEKQKAAQRIKEFSILRGISHLWINRIRTSQSLDPFCNGDGNEHL